MLRRTLAALIVFALLPVVAAAADPPKLAVYPFTVNGTAPPEVGSTFADAIGNDVTASGGVAVVHGDVSLTRAQFRDDAKAQGAEFFLIGAIVPIGAAYSVIEQLVRTRTGLLVWSVSYQVENASGLKGQGSMIRDALYAQLGFLSYRSALGASAVPTSPPSAEPAATATSAAGAAPATGDRSDALRVPAAQPTLAPPSTFAVVVLGGTALPSDRTYAVRVVLEAIRKRGLTAAATAGLPSELQTAGARACSDTRALTIVAGTLDTSRITSVTAAPTTTAAIALQMYDCKKHALAGKSYVASTTAPIGTDAIRSAADEAVTAYFGSPAPEPHL